MLLALGSGCAAAPAAMAAGFSEGAFNELKNKAQERTFTQKTTSTASTESTSSSGSGSGSRTLLVLGLGVAIVLLVGIGYAIFRDARKVAPAGDGQLAEMTGTRRPATRLHKRRAQAKAARRQRKRNR
jgi:predicted metalloprotease